VVFLLAYFVYDRLILKSLIAYSSVAHISMVIGGIITLSYWGGGL
jgi:NADH:ubiquinone oxidoreductase subunit 4 (subunit M)